MIDGLDEATGWTVDSTFLPSLPANVRLVVSARLQLDDRDGSGWMKRLGWENPRTAHSMPVPPLNEQGCREALASMGAPLDALPDAEGIVRELTRLTEGDPLLLGFYVEDLWTKGDAVAQLRPQDLRGLAAGFRGYFRRWLDEQKAAWRGQGPIIDTLLKVFASAIGPLPHADLSELARRLAGPDTDVNEVTLAPLRRFLIGDQHDGYSLCHPRLAQHLREEYFRDPYVIQRAEEVFAAWGLDVVADLNKKALKEEENKDKTSRYLLRHLSTHLLRAKVPPDQMMTLVEDGWRQAWKAFDGGESGFARDVRRCADAMAATHGSDQPTLAYHIRCALVLSSIASIGTNIPPELLAAAVAAGEMPALEALYLIRYQEDFSQAQALTALAPHLSDALLPDALNAIREIRDDRYRAEALAALAPHLSETLHREALVAARDISDDWCRADALAALAPHLPEALHREALAAAREISDDWYQAAAGVGPAIGQLDAGARAVGRDQAVISGIAIHLQNTAEAV